MSEFREDGEFLAIVILILLLKPGLPNRIQEHGQGLHSALTGCGDQFLFRSAFAKRDPFRIGPDSARKY